MISLEERVGRLEQLLQNLEHNVFSGLRVSLPAIVTSFDPEKQTISCVPAVRELVNTNGKVKFTTLPELKDVPIQLPRSGGWSITFPIKPGDECMVVFQDLCIDGWWFRGGIQNWNDLRRHDLSDAIAIFSPYSQPNALSSYNTQGMEIRSDDGSIKITLTEDGVKMIFPQGFKVEGDGEITGDLSIKGDVSVDGDVAVTGDVTAGTISLKEHTHLYIPGLGSEIPTGEPQ